jgi:hypothetical protein
MNLAKGNGENTLLPMANIGYLGVTDYVCSEDPWLRQSSKNGTFSGIFLGTPQILVPIQLRLGGFYRSRRELVYRSRKLAQFQLPLFRLNRIF